MTALYLLSAVAGSSGLGSTASYVPTPEMDDEARTRVVRAASRRFIVAVEARPAAAEGPISAAGGFFSSLAPAAIARFLRALGFMASYVAIAEVLALLVPYEDILLDGTLARMKPSYHVCDDKYVRIAARRIGKGRGSLGFGNARAVQALLLGGKARAALHRAAQPAEIPSCPLLPRR